METPGPLDPEYHGLEEVVATDDELDDFDGPWVIITDKMTEQTYNVLDSVNAALFNHKPKMKLQITRAREAMFIKVVEW